MIKTPCPLCDKQMDEHTQSQIKKCLWTFVREARNPVAFAAINSRTCPECEKKMLDHNPSQVNECVKQFILCLLYTSPSPRDATLSRMPSSA